MKLVEQTQGYGVSFEALLVPDASKMSIAAAAYLREVNVHSCPQVGFIMGKAKLTPHPEPTIPSQSSMQQS